MDFTNYTAYTILGILLAYFVYMVVSSKNGKRIPMQVNFLLAVVSLLVGLNIETSHFLTLNIIGFGFAMPIAYIALCKAEKPNPVKDMCFDIVYGYETVNGELQDCNLPEFG